MANLLPWHIEPMLHGTSFRVEAGLADAVGLLVLMLPRHGSWLAALLVASSALGAVLLYRYVTCGLPSDPEPGNTTGASG